MTSFASLLFAPIQAAAAAPAKPVPHYGFAIVHAFPHDPAAFTQGLEFRDGYLYEGTGLHGRSTLRKVQLETGHVLQEISVPSEYFGEGITVLDGQITELTWQSHTGFVYDRQTFRKLKTFHYAGEGWGLANDGRHIYFSDGTAKIRVLNSTSLETERAITVHEGVREVARLNELECVRGEIYANIWGEDRIARIAPADGRVIGWIELAGLLSPADRTSDTDVLNGIAYDAKSRRLFVTGKLWPKLFEIRLRPKILNDRAHP